MKNGKAFLILLLSVLCFNKAFAQEGMFKALFMYNFTKYIEWPSEYHTDDFVITILGSSEISGELEKLATKKKVGNQQIIIKKASAVSDIEKSHIIYISPSKSSNLVAIKEKFTTSPTLIVTDKEGLAEQGAGINYVKIDGKQKFEVNSNSITSCGLKVNSALIALGIKVN